MPLKTQGSAPNSAEKLEDVLVLAQVDPRGARALARALLQRAGDAETITVAERALGLAAKELNDIGGATRHLLRARDAALAAGLGVRAAQARMSLSLVLAYSGDTAEALRQADLAAPALRGQDGARLQMQRTLILQRLGRLDEALEGYRRVLAAMRRLRDLDGEARLLANRGVLHAHRGDFAAADADLQLAVTAFEADGQRLHAAEARHNLGFVAGRRGDVPRALQMYDGAESEFQALGMRRGVPLLDRCETMLSVRLLPEARAAGEAAMAEFEATGMKADLAEAELLLAQVALLEGDACGAQALALRARRAFIRQRRWGWASLAQFAWLRGSWAGEDKPTRQMLRTARQVAAELSSSGWVAPATEAHVIAASIALALGLVDEAEEELRPLGGKARRAGPVDLRARAWHAEGLLRYARGENRAADLALRAGLRVLAQHQATLGATELRVHAGARAEDLAHLGMKIAMDSNRAARVLGWSERWRAGAMRWRPAVPTPDEGVAGLLGELRHVVSLIEGGAADASDVASLVRRQTALEAQVRKATWRVEGERTVARDAPPTVEELRAALGDSALVELVDFESEIHAISVCDRRAVLMSLGSAAEIEAEVANLRFAVSRLVRPNRPPSGRAADALDHASRRLDELLLAPLERVIDARSLVMIPTGSLHALPWATLPSLRGRSVTVSPSAAIWLKAVSSSRSPAAETVLVAGPGLSHAAEEVRTLANLHLRTTTLVEAEATTSNVLGAFRGAGLVHVVAHGRFRDDNALFSSLGLADGPLMVYDLEQLELMPRCLVLSACDAGLSTVRPGNELMGLSSALLSLGVETLIASVVPVSDAFTRSLMVELHRRMIAGERPAQALANAHLLLGGDGAASHAQAAGFACFGAG